MKSNNVEENKYKKLCCPNCKSKNIKKNGRRKTQNRGLIQRYKCKDCEYRFTNDDGFLRMRNHPKKITCAIDLFYRGVSTRKVQEHFQAFYPENSSHKSIYKWIIKYSKIISKFTDNLKLQIGKELQVDEMEYHRRKYYNKKGVDKNWFIDAVDCKTRFMVSSEYTKARGKNELKLVIKKAKDKTGEQIKICATDGLLAYGNIVKKNWGYNNKLGKYMVEHNVVNASKGEGFNIMIERLHNSIRERTKTMRGFHGSIESANAIMKGLEIYYNFIRKHQALNKVPYELACPNLELKSNNRWLELIKLSKA
jgi:transposase-like protein